MQPELLPQIYNQDEGDIVVINSNYAIDAGIKSNRRIPLQLKSSENNPYVNIIAVRNW